MLIVAIPPTTTPAMAVIDCYSRKLSCLYSRLLIFCCVLMVSSSVASVCTAAPAATSTECSAENPAQGTQQAISHPTSCDVTVGSFFYSRAEAGGSSFLTDLAAGADVLAFAESVTNVEDTFGEATAASSIDFGMLVPGPRRPGRIFLFWDAYADRGFGAGSAGASIDITAEDFSFSVECSGSAALGCRATVNGEAASGNELELPFLLGVPITVSLSANSMGHATDFDSGAGFATARVEFSLSDLNPSDVVPEPASIAFSASGLGVLVLLYRKRRSNYECRRQDNLGAQELIGRRQ
jgi:hypothetical protein